MTEHPTLARLFRLGLLENSFLRDGRIVCVLRCSQCGVEFERDLHGSGLTTRIVDSVYCGRRCSSQAIKAKSLRSGGDSQLMRFRRYKEQTI